MRKRKNKNLSILDNLENNPLKYYKFSKKIGTLNKDFNKRFDSSSTNRTSGSV